MNIMLDPGAILNIAISVSIGSIIATLIVWLLVSYFVRKSIIGVLNDGKIYNGIEKFIENHVVSAFNALEDVEIKKLIEETVELALKKIKGGGEQKWK